MIIARQKKKENIAEYVLYMWQVEDMIRASHFDIEVIQSNFIDKFDQPEEVKGQMRTWYSDIINMMQEEHVTEKGHIQIVKNVVNDIDELHLVTLLVPNDALEIVTTLPSSLSPSVDLTPLTVAKVFADFFE